MLTFAGIGAQKAGTTWLYDKLRLHQDVAFPAGKEVHYWDQKQNKGVRWYRSLFEAPENESKLCGEITPAYAILPEDRIRRCHDIFPTLKLIYLIRNPIDRAWSSAKMALARAEMEVSEASARWFLDHIHSKGSMMRGDYESCLRNWLSVYPRDQMLVCLHDELQTDPRTLLKRCFEHIGVDGQRYNWSVDLATKIFATDDYPLPESLKAELHRIYLPKIYSLEDYLQLDLSSWR